jgi:hypothetical protein
MANKIKPKRSYTASSVPLTSDLDTHELAIRWNSSSPAMFTKDAAGNIVSVTLGGGSYTLPAATVSSLGGIIVGSGLSISSGVLSATGGGGSYTLPVATASVLGGVKAGSNVTIGGDGTLSVAAPTTDASALTAGTLAAARLPIATGSAVGGVIVGTGLSITSSVLSAAVSSVNSKTGAVSLSASDVGAPASNTTGITGAAAITNIVSLTAAQYTALGTKSATTLYIISG